MASVSWVSALHGVFSFSLSSPIFSLSLWCFFFFHGPFFLSLSLIQFFFPPFMVFLNCLFSKWLCPYEQNCYLRGPAGLKPTTGENSEDGNSSSDVFRSSFFVAVLLCLLLIIQTWQFDLLSSTVNCPHIFIKPMEIGPVYLQSPAHIFFFSFL